MYPALLTEKYLNYLAYDALTSNVTLIMGDKVPNVELNRMIKVWFSRCLNFDFFLLKKCFIGKIKWTSMKYQISKIVINFVFY